MKSAVNVLCTCAAAFTAVSVLWAACAAFAHAAHDLSAAMRKAQTKQLRIVRSEKE